jgi:ribosomal protein S18 acetylase RimI-like enzyme
MYKISDFDMSKIEIYNYSKPNPGLNYNEFTAYCRTQKKVILDDYILRKLNEFYIYSNKGFYVDEVIEKEYYKLVHSYFVKDYDCNYVIDVKDKENFIEIENDVEQEMKKINAEPCYIITPLSDLYLKRDKVFKKDKYEEINKEVWQVFENFNNLEDIESNCKMKIKLEKSTDMIKLAQITLDAFNTGDSEDPYESLDEGYLKMYENYKGTNGTKYNRDFYFIKANEKIVGVTTAVYDDRIYGIYGIAILKEFRGKGIGTECLKQQLMICKKKNRKMAFLQTEEGYYPAKLYRKIGFKDVCTAYYYVKKD